MATSDSKSSGRKSSNRSEKDKQYTRPELRKQLKDQIQKGDKGGRKEEWSARKSQLLVNEYEKAGGGYTSSKRTKTQRNLEDWGDEEWTTKDGRKAIRGDKTHRYLPKKAWDKLSRKEKDATDARKVRDDDGKTQYVQNTEKAKKARGAARKEARRGKSGGKGGGSKKSGGKGAGSKKSADRKKG